MQFSLVHQEKKQIKHKAKKNLKINEQSHKKEKQLHHITSY